ncbi:hypothetical protein N7G274_006923 [Stereocaulon virgatum]|uniref:LIM zinc-binding domain-containing protein n=1 Tax=Stereocaulon virgatum TaxID=373712 RepID=A0ABR4A4W8_9LECA
MADPLSIAAGVAGIMTAAAQIASLLIKFTKSAKDAPQQARVIITEVSDTSGILSHLQSFLVGSEFRDRSRTSLLKVDQVVTIVSGCVLTFSELEKLLDEINIQHMKIPDCFKWARNESTITDLIHRLQNHKVSLSLMLNILNGSTIADAKDSVDRLYTLVETCYGNMSSRLSALETKQTQLADSALTIRPDEDTASILTASPDPSNCDVTLAVNSEVQTHDFTEVLQRSWVYTWNRAFQSSIYSLPTTDAHSTRWSCLSGLSMAEVSSLSVLNLVITVNEVCNSSRSSQTWSSKNVPSVSEPQCSTIALPSHKPTEYNDMAYRCMGCGEMLEEGFAFELGKIWHRDCYRCNTCGTIFDQDAPIFLSNEGSLFFTNCLHDRSVCGKKIDDTSIFAGDQIFCAQCFRCHNWNGQIISLKFAKTSQGIFCMRCHNSLMEKGKKKAEGISKFYDD